MKWYNYTALGINKTLDSVIKMNDLESYIQNLPAGTPLYHGYYSFEQRPHYKEYSGLLTFTFDTVHIDLDSKDDAGELAWTQTKALCTRLRDAGVGFQLYFSGNKGFHVAIHKTALGLNEPLPHSELSQKVKSFLTGLKAEYSTVDPITHDPSRKFRAYRSQHEKSKLYKIRLTGIGIKPSALTLEEIRTLAKTQPMQAYAHPEPPTVASDWLVSLIKNAPVHTVAKVNVRELNQGETLEDETLKFRNFADKKCVKAMLTGEVLPQFNRHDVELVLVSEMRSQGKPFSEAEKIIRKWAERVYGADTDRITDSVRQLKDSYARDIAKDYKFGCYGDVKSAYCSAKCKIYGMLDARKRPEPLDCTDKQKKQNEIRRNEMLELSEGEIADNLLSKFPRLSKSSGQYFQWLGTHWERIDGDLFEDRLLKTAIACYENQAPIKKVKALVEHIIAKIPVAPESNCFFASSPNKFNFLDGTAWVLQEGKSLRIEMRPHAPSDYLAYCAPFPLYGEHKLPKGTEFTKYMEARLVDQGADGVRIIKQMLGAALIPYVPRIFFIEGVTNSGKSTLAKLIKKLLGAENVSSVEPVARGMGADRFTWEPSIGKIANIVIELNKANELDVNTLKKVRDKEPENRDRKNKSHVQATLPFLHIYCCNKMPPSYEGNSGALNNRISMLYFKPGYLNGSSDIVEYADTIWNDDAGTVLEVAREGLADLVASGFKYFTGEKSEALTAEWQKMTDNISLYITDVNNEEFRQPAWEGVEWEKGSIIYSDFREWCQMTGVKPMGKQHFYRDLESRFGMDRKRNAEGGERFRVDKVFKRVLKTEVKENPSQQPSALSVQSH